MISIVYFTLTTKTVAMSLYSTPRVKVKVEKVDVNDSVITQTPLPQLPQLLGFDCVPTDTTPGPSATTITPKVENDVNCQTKNVLHDILGDVFITSVEPPKSLHDLVQNEITSFKTEPAIILNSNRLEWWKTNGGRYPHLATAAKALLCIPATSVPSERGFVYCG